MWPEYHVNRLSVIAVIIRKIKINVMMVNSISHEQKTMCQQGDINVSTSFSVN